MKHQKHNRKIKWPLIWLLQALAMLIASSITALTLWLGGTMHAAMSWIFMPVAGFISAMIATRSGLLNYAAWIAPPLMMFISHCIFWVYSPKPGPIFLCAFISLVGAATGEVMKQQQKKKDKGDHPWKKT